MHKHGGPRGSGNYSKSRDKVSLPDISDILDRKLPKAEICNLCGRAFLVDGGSDCAIIKREKGERGGL